MTATVAVENILLITGSPGIGKTTVIKKVLAGLPDLPAAGFYAEEIRRRSVRQGFELVALHGERCIMAHSDILSRHRLGKYGVDVEAIANIARHTLHEGSVARFFILDEIGRMECFSIQFVQVISSIFDTGKPVVATVAMKGGGFIADVKNLPGVTLWEVTKSDRDHMADRIIHWIRSKC